MLIFTVRRVLSSVLVLLVSSFVIFVGSALTFDPLKPFRQRQPLPSAEFFAAKRKQFGLDKPVLERYWDWLTHVVRGDFGKDINGGSVEHALFTRLAVTSRMVILAMVAAILLAIAFGVLSGVRKGKPIDLVLTVFTYLLIALPTFWFASLLKDGGIRINTAAGHRVFYTAGDETFGASSFESGWTLYQDRLLHLILPTVSLALLYAAGWIRYQRASTIDVLDADYMRLARAKGVRWPTVIRRHGLRNALIPLTTVVALDVGAVFGGVIISEQVYVWHGMGEYFIQNGIGNEDVNVVAGWVMISSVFVVLFNLIADLLYAVLDPRIRLA